MLDLSASLKNGRMVEWRTFQSGECKLFTLQPRALSIICICLQAVQSIQILKKIYLRLRYLVVIKWSGDEVMHGHSHPEYLD